jgi:UV DNA damage endonuclease
MRILPTLCCLFVKEDIKFRTFTISSLTNLTLEEKRNKVLDIYKHNIITLQKALDKCKELKIHSYRISSDLLPKFNYVKINDIINSLDVENLELQLKKINRNNIILSMHPDQFVVLNSLDSDIVIKSFMEIKYHLWLSKLLNVDSINVHIGGVYKDKQKSINNFIIKCRRFLSPNELSKLTIENDEKSFSIDDILYISKKLNIRPVFDIHHHKCFSINNKPNKELNEYLLECLLIWKKLDYKYFQLHLSSPREYIYSTLKNSIPHADFISKNDIPDFSFLKDLNMDIVIDIEAKAKELAVLKFIDYLSNG